jgi:hypothetical protein
MSFSVKSFKFLCGFVKLDLSSLGFCNFPLKLIGFSCNLNGKLFNLKSELFDLGLVCPSIFFKSKVILLLLSGSKSPLFKLLLIPIHFELELVHLLISFKDHVLNVI